MGTCISSFESPWSYKNFEAYPDTALVVQYAANVREFVSGCFVCAQNKEPKAHPQGPLHLLPIPRRPWSHISLDFVPGLPKSQGNIVIFVAVDMQHVFRIHGFPQDMVSDRGSQFTSRFWKAFGRLIGASISLSSGFQPQSNGQTERVNQEIEKTLRSQVSNNQSTWGSRLIWAEFDHNTLHHSSLGMSPFECQFGFPPSLFPEQELEVQVPAATQLVQRCHQAWRKAHTALVRASQRQRKQAITTSGSEGVVVN